MEFSSRIALLGCVIVLAISVQSSLAGTSVSSGKQVSGAANSLPAESERSGWSYPTGYSWSNNAVSFGLPLVLIPLIYFGFLWCVLLFGLSAFHHSPAYHRGLHSGGHGGHGVHGAGSLRSLNRRSQHDNSKRRRKSSCIDSKKLTIKMV
ncbi:unnamed protein product [Allacma fusca]|uniref:Uncharacterized protein n=1 Tax=Allacma fusca TaxID=39272 RepID=A0A8J2KDZ1_9HEXA|nr:unnamed protein product [Allacma fusca]